jgi:hypothetical protein
MVSRRCLPTALPGRAVPLVIDRADHWLAEIERPGNHCRHELHVVIDHQQVLIVGLVIEPVMMWFRASAVGHRQEIFRIGNAVLFQEPDQHRQAGVGFLCNLTR